MIFNEQDRQEGLERRSSPVILSAAKDLSRRAPRSFAALRMTTYDRTWSGKFIIAPWGGEGIPHVPMNLLICIITLVVCHHNRSNLLPLMIAPKAEE